MEKLASAVSAKESLEKENAALQTSVRESQSSLTVLQQSLHQAESEKEQSRLEVEALERSKISVQGSYEQTKKESQELQVRIQALSSKVLGMTKDYGELDAKLQHVLGEKSRASMDYNKVEQEKTILEKSNAWLQEELERKMVASSEERKKATQEYIALKDEMNEKVQVLKQVEGDKARLAARLADEERALKKSNEELRSVKEELADKVESFEKELQQTQRMAQLYRESSEEHAKRSAELQGIVNELKVDMDQMHAKHQETVLALEEEVRSARELAEEEATMRKKVVDAYQAEMFTSTPEREREDGGESDDGCGVPSAMKKSAVEMYALYVESEETLRKERVKFQREKIRMEQDMIDIDKKVRMVVEQEATYNRMTASYENLLREIEEVSAEKRRLEGALRDSEGKTRSLGRENCSLEQQVRDLGQQVARLLHEAANGKSASPGGGFVGGNAGDVTTQFLVEFSSVEELQQQNERLLKINRELAAAAEATRAEAAMEAEQEYGERVFKLETAIEDLKRKNLHTEEIFQRVSRQRDELRQMLSSAGGDLEAGRELYAAASGERTPAPVLTGVTPSTAMQMSGPGTAATNVSAENLQYREMYDDLEKKFEDYKKNSNAEYSTLEKELSSAQNDLLALKKQISQIQGQGDYEKERSKRLSSTVDSLQTQIDSQLQRNAEIDARASETERRLVVAQQNSESAEERMRALNNKVASLESEKRILMDAEKRLSAEASALSQDKFRFVAELDVLRKQYNQLEASSAQDVSKAQVAAAKSAGEASEAQRDLAVQKGRAEYAHREIQQLKEERKQERMQLEAKLESAQADLSEMQRRASVAEAKRDLLQEAVRKSEEKIARLEIERNARLSAASDQVPAPDLQQTGGFGLQSPGTVDMKIKELQTEIKILREELASAQGALAAETGHAKQFETLAHTAEEALKSSQADFQKFKIDAQNRYASIETEVKRLRMEIAKKDIAIKELKQDGAKVRQECEGLKHQVELEKANSKQATHQTIIELEREKQKVAELSSDVERLRKEADESRKAYDAEVVAHGDAVRRVTAAEASVVSVQARLDVALSELQNERADWGQKSTENRAIIDQQREQIGHLQKKTESLARQRDTLQDEVEKLVTSCKNTDAAVDTKYDPSNTIKIIRQERDAAELHLSLSEREVTRLRQENAIAKRSAEEARSQLSAEIERQTSKKTEEQENRVGYLEQISITRESNMALRSDNTEKQKKIDTLLSQARESQSNMDKLQMQLKHKDSEIAAVKEELRIANENAKRWEQRSAVLSEKSVADVDAAEHEQLKAELKKSQEELAKTIKQRDDIDSRLKLAQNVARQAQAMGTNLKKQLAAMEAKTKELSADKSKATAAQNKKQEVADKEKDKKIAELTAEKAALDGKVKELTEASSRTAASWKEKVKASLAAAEKSQHGRKQAMDKVRELNAKVKTLEQEKAALKDAAAKSAASIPVSTPFGAFSAAPTAFNAPVAPAVPSAPFSFATVPPSEAPSHKRKHVDAPAQEPEEEEPIKKLRPSATEFSPTKQASTSPEVESLVARAIHQAVNREVVSHPVSLSPHIPVVSPAEPIDHPETVDVAEDGPEPAKPAITPQAEIPAVAEENTQMAPPVDTMDAVDTGDATDAIDAMDAAQDFLGSIDGAAEEGEQEDYQLADEPEDQPYNLQDDHQDDDQDDQPDDHPDDHPYTKDEDKEDGKDEDRREKKRKAKPIVWNPK